MKSGIKFNKIWFDNDLIELRVNMSDGKSMGSCDEALLEGI